MHSNISLVDALSLILFAGTSKTVGKTVAVALEVMREKRAAVRQEVRVMHDREVFVFRDLVRFKIFLNLVFMVWDHLFRSIYNIFNFIIAGGGGKSNAGKGGTNQKGGGTVGENSPVKAGSSVSVLSEAEKREMQKAMLEEIFRRYYPYSDFFGWK